MMDYCIVFTSSSLLSEAELIRLMTNSQINNRNLGITGILLYFNGSVIEVLEGPEESVKALYDVIRRDPRHTLLIKLYQGFVKKRSFPDWLMGYKALSAKEIDHIRERIPSIDSPSSPVPGDENVILALVQVFYKNNYRN